MVKKKKATKAVKKTADPKKAKQKVSLLQKKRKKETDVPKEKTPQEKHDLVRQHVLAHIWRNEESSFKQMLDDLEIVLAPFLEGSVSGYIKTVKEDLEAKNVIEKVPGKKKEHLRLKQRIGKRED